MLIQFSETSGRATGDCQPGRSPMRDGAMPRNSNPVPGTLVGRRGGRLSESSPAFRHRAGFMNVQGEHPSLYSSCREPDADFRDDIAFRVFGSILFLMFILPLILAGIAVKFG